MKLGILVCCYNRPEYLSQCLNSLLLADIPHGTVICIVDDCSTEPEVKRVISDYMFQASPKGVWPVVHTKDKNRSIKDSIMVGCDILFTLGCDTIINLDGDAIVKQNFVQVLTKLKEKFPYNIITGFNCRTKNRNGSERHVVISEGDGYNLKKSVGGINMMFDRAQYDKWIDPAIKECLQFGGNWDHKTCLKSEASMFSIVCAVPSVVQHIGINSSMGHSTGGEPPDVADDFDGLSAYPELKAMADQIIASIPKPDFANVYYSEEQLSRMKGMERSMNKSLAERFLLDEESKWPRFERWKDGRLRLPEVTLVGVDCVDINRLVKAADISCKNIDFGNVVLLSSIPSSDPRVKQIKRLPTKGDYSDFMMKRVAEYVWTSHMLVIQYDGYVLNPLAWNDKWLEYDYIGAPWMWYTDGKQVGNGGFSLRTKKIMQITANDDGIVPINEMGVTKHREEDHCICRLYRDYLEREYKMKFAPVEEAAKFSIEGWNSQNKTWTNEFGFHGHGLTNIKP